MFICARNRRAWYFDTEEFLRDMYNSGAKSTFIKREPILGQKQVSLSAT